MNRFNQSGLLAVLVILSCLLPYTARGEVVEYNLTIAFEEVNFTGRPVKAMTINGGIPGPTLRFKVGDTARIHVHNKMEEPTSIHWHGVLVPPDMDGVPFVSFPPVAPGSTFTYEFPIRHSGTYWYHSHSGLQEQRGIYGSLVFDPNIETVPADRDYVVLFSDWTDEDPHTVLRTLKRGSEWYALEKGSAQSIFGAARAGKLGDYFGRELSRMPAMDIADVAYDRFLANGRPEVSFKAVTGEMVRLRIIDGSATTYFHLQFAGGPMTIITADGQNVEPVEKEIFLIAVAETYDVLVKVPDEGSWELRATAHDGSGYASVWIGEGARHPAPDLPRPNLYRSMMDPTFKGIFALTPAGAMDMSDRDIKEGRFDNPGMNMDMGMSDMQDMEGKDRQMDMPDSSTMKTMGEKSAMPGMGQDAENDDSASEMMSTAAGLTREGRMFGKSFRYMAADVSSSWDLAVDGMDPRRPGTPYKDLKTKQSTILDLDRPVREIRLTLDGDMERYVWLLNKKTLSESDSILIRKGEVVRFIMINRTMMHHPMHLHGHFFRVINGQGDRSPLKHTVDVAPMTTTVIEFAANEVGDWFFHCHLLYHMKSGMAQVVHYDGYDPGHAVNAVRYRLYQDPWYFWGNADLLSNMTAGTLVAARTRHILMLDWEVGWENVTNTEWEGTLTWDLYLNRFSSIFVGANYEEVDEVNETVALAGLRYLLPLNIDWFAWVDSEGEKRFGVEKEFVLTPRLTLVGELEYDTGDKWEGNSSLSFLVSRWFSILVQHHTEFQWGGGVQVRF